MKRFIFGLICALMLGGLSPISAWAGREEHTGPEFGNPSVGDDDEPLFRSPSDTQVATPVAVRVPPQSGQQVNVGAAPAGVDVGRANRSWPSLLRVWWLRLVAKSSLPEARRDLR